MTALEQLEQFQQQFSAMLRSPLDRSTGTLRARTDTYARELVQSVCDAGVDPRERLAVYNRQYWFRLFGVLQQEHRLTVALLGAWAFNDLATQFLVAKPPQGHDLGAIAEGFAAFASAMLQRKEIAEALAIDRAFRTAALAPPERSLHIGPAEAARLPVARLVWSRSLTLVEEHWPLVTLRQRLPNLVDDTTAPLPAPHESMATWAIHRTEQGLRCQPLEPLHAELLHLLRTHAIGEALAVLEHRRSSGVVAARVKDWFAADLASGFWTGLEGNP
ncbi:MAG: DNA-binding domain-containing protein [Kofleriaceae bacterium]|nr:DNA-binding domain-containing protein [Kofleriaceae bacterium]